MSISKPAIVKEHLHDVVSATATGLLQWTVPADAPAEDNFILSMRDDAGQEVFHPFKVRVE